MQIRSATAEDVPAITRIYNQAVTDTTASFDLEPQTNEQRVRWLTARAVHHPVFVAEEKGRIAGWGSLSPYSDRAAYDATAEISVYIDRDYHRRGLGAAMGERLVAEARVHGLHVLVARVCTENDASLRLFRRMGFADCGRMHEVGRKFGRWLDVAILELPL
ncbi:MAG: N-acetyltransferase family protein [Actinobacteria bacterium]|nr:N-acetyltransferase family protein [Actinomycetota bacterium]